MQESPGRFQGKSRKCHLGEEMCEKLWRNRNYCKKAAQISCIEFVVSALRKKMDSCQQVYYLPSVIHGLAHGLKCGTAKGTRLHLLPLGADRSSHQFLNWWQQYATGILQFDCSSPFLRKKYREPKGSLYFLVRQKGLEPPTY